MQLHTKTLVELKENSNKINFPFQFDFSKVIDMNACNELHVVHAAMRHNLLVVKSMTHIFPLNMT